jgi:hypothetical protein
VRKLLALVFSGPLLAISIITFSLTSAFVSYTPANAVPNSIEIISITDVSSTSVEILFNSNVPKKSLAYFVINATVDDLGVTQKNIKKKIIIKSTGLITVLMKNLSPKASYKFSISAKPNNGKMISSQPVEYSSINNLLEMLTNLPADWENPKPIPQPTPTPTSAPVAPTVISVASIAGVTAPVTGATPVTTTTAGTGYTGAVSWNGSPGTFASVTTYTATITLTPTSGYTLTGVTADFFTVAGATSDTNSSNSEVVTAVFPATLAGPAANIAITQASVGTARLTAFTTQPKITIRDSSNNTVTSSAALVTASVSAGGTLVGTATVTASSGVATFTDLGVDGTIGTLYTISYNVESLTTTTATVTLTGTTCDGVFICQVGDRGPGGGVIYYVSASNFTSTGSTCNTACKYLEAAPTSGVNAWTELRYIWSGNTTQYIGTAGGMTIGTGYANTLAIVGQSGGGNTEHRAGTIARAYRGPNNLSDWFLPSKDELHQLNLQKTVVSGFAGNTYWSSSEYTDITAQYEVLNSGFQYHYLKEDPNYVRPVRAF